MPADQITTTPPKGTDEASSPQSPSVPRTADPQPFADPELQKISDDVLHGLHYSFLSAATGQDKPG